MLGLSAREIFPVPAMPYAPLSYTCFKTKAYISVDGVLNDTDWQKTQWTTDFIDIIGNPTPAPEKQTRVKMLWSERGLYIGAEIMEDHIWATLKQRDAVIFFDNDFEVFIDPDGDTHEYYELEINALGTLWDLLLAKPYRDRQRVAIDAWDIRDIKGAVHCAGTINNPDDKDLKWEVEMFIPWDVLSECSQQMTCPPKPNDYWRMNFSRVQWQTEVENGLYLKKIGIPESNWVWSPQGLVAMHYPERWGFVLFSDKPAGTKELLPNPCNTPKEQAREYLRQVYYKQKQYFMDNKKYAKSLSKLKADKFTYQGKTQKLIIETTSQSYIMTLPATADYPALHISEDGRLWVKE
jgi:hypothetical protein